MSRAVILELDARMLRIRNFVADARSRASDELHFLSRHMG